MMEFGSLVPVVVLMLAGVGYLIRRFVEGNRESEVVDNAQKWARLFREVHDRQPSVDDILRLKAKFMEKKQRTGTESEQKVVIEAGEAPEWMFFGHSLTEWEREKAGKGEGIWTQLELNEQAARAAEIANESLESACQELRSMLTPLEVQCFDAALESWKKYRKLQSTYAGSQYEGGSIAPMVYWSENFGVTKDKLNFVREDARFRRETVVREDDLLNRIAAHAWEENADSAVPSKDAHKGR